MTYELPRTESGDVDWDEFYDILQYAAPYDRKKMTQSAIESERDACLEIIDVIVVPFDCTGLSERHHKIWSVGVDSACDEMKAHIKLREYGGDYRGGFIRARGESE